MIGTLKFAVTCHRAGYPRCLHACPTVAVTRRRFDCASRIACGPFDSSSQHRRSRPSRCLREFRVAQPAPQAAQETKDQGQLPPINVAAPHPKPHARAKKSGAQTAASRQPSHENAAPPLQWLAGIPMTPLNEVAPSASRLSLPVLQTPASIDIVTQQTMQEQGYRNHQRSRAKARSAY